jgi:threonine synthase
VRLCSTNDRSLSVSFTDAVRMGIAPDGGLFIPAAVARCPAGFLEGTRGLSFPEISSELARILLADEIPREDLSRITGGAITFDAPLRQLDQRTAVLELFHGPTLAFKDFGARFMAHFMSYMQRNESRGYTVLVATSGDTGSAVASAFQDVPGASVVLLYPSGKVSPIQERQLTAFRANVAPLEIEGTFDDCQRLVKQAFADRELSSRRRLTSANSINVARLLPQTFYYFNAFARIVPGGGGIVFSVPSGNLGNLTAGLMAWKMGLPVTRFVAALNANDVFGRFLDSGTYRAGSAIATISNAMDVGNPGNLPRIRALFDDDIAGIRRQVWATSCTDDETRGEITRAFEKYEYAMDPHGAVASIALGRYRERSPGVWTGVLLETAHPAKFLDVYDADVRKSIRVPERLNVLLDGQKHSVKLGSGFEELKAYLMEM